MSQGELEKLENLATLMDAEFRIPGTQIKFGWDFLLGVIPGVGDVATLIPSAILIQRAYALGARKRTVGRMVINTSLDATIGAVPVIGDLFDLVFKSNRRNLGLLRNDLIRRAALRHGMDENIADSIADYGGSP